MLAPVRNRRRLNACPNLYFCSGTCRVRVDQGASEAQGSQPVRALGTSREDVRSLGSGRAPRARRAYRTLGVEFRGRRLPLRPSRSALSHHPVAGTPMSEIDRSPASHSPHDRPADTQCPPTFFARGGKGSDPLCRAATHGRHGLPTQSRDQTATPAVRLRADTISVLPAHCALKASSLPSGANPTRRHACAAEQTSA